MHPHHYLLAPGDIPIATDRFYHRDHYWILCSSSSSGHHRVGLSAYVCRPGIEVYFVENLPAPGASIAEGDLLGVIETEKAVVSIYSPMACQVIAINTAVLDDPNCISSGPYDVWILEIQFSGPLSLLSAGEYLEYLRTLPPPQCFPIGRKS